MQSTPSKLLNKALSLLLFVWIAMPCFGQISLPGKTTYDKFLSAFWSQNSNASNLVAGINANAEIPFDNDSITNTFTNKLYQGTLTLTNDPIFRTWDGGSAAWYYWNFQTSNGLPMWSNTVSRIGMTETLSNKTIWSPTITNTSEQWNFNIRTNQTTNTVLRVLDILTTNNTAASWLSALGFSEAETQPITGYGTVGFFPYYNATNTITNTTLFYNGTTYGLTGGLTIGTTNGTTAGNNNLYVTGDILVGATDSSYHRLNILNSTTNTSDARDITAVGTYSFTTNSAYYNYGAVLSLADSYCAEGVTNSGQITGLNILSYINNTNHKGTFNNIYGETIYHGITVNGSGTNVTSVGLYINGRKAAGTMTTLYGLYETGNDKNYFGATNNGFGTTTPAAKVAINGGLHVGGDTDPGDNNVAVDGNAYVAGTAFANVVRGTNYHSSDGSIGITINVTNTFGTGLTNVMTFKNGLLITNVVTQ